MFSWHIRAQLRLYAIFLIFGALAGIFVLLPASEFVYFEEYRPTATTPLSYTAEQVKRSLRGETPRKTTYYALVGVVLSLAGATLFATLQRRAEKIQQLSTALEADLETLIARGEGATLEFKSSLRWDRRENRVNRGLETVILKTLAGYMNGSGGTLLIGIADNGTIVGLKQDYQTLKKPDRDGFEQTLMTLVANRLGADACRSLHVLFQTLEKEEVCRVLVTPVHRPVYLKDGEVPKLYVRTGVSTRELNVQEAIDYTSARWSK